MENKTNFSISVKIDNIHEAKKIYIKTRLNIQQNSEFVIKYSTATEEHSQNFDLIPGENLLYYTLEADSPIEEVSIIFEEYLDEPIILKEFELRK